MPVLSGRTGLPIEAETRTDWLSSYKETLDRDAETARQEQEDAVKATKHVEALRTRYKVASGKLLVSRDPVQTTWDDSGEVGIVMTADRRYQMAMHTNWGTVLVVGGGFNTDYGQRHEPDPEWVPGARVMYNPAGADAVEVSAGGETMTVLLIGFRGVQMIDRGDRTVEVEGGAV